MPSREFCNPGFRIDLSEAGCLCLAQVQLLAGSLIRLAPRGQSISADAGICIQVRTPEKKWDWALQSHLSMVKTPQLVLSRVLAMDADKYIHS